MLNRMSIILELDRMEPGERRIFESARDRLSVNIREDGTILIDGLPFFFESAINIIETIKPVEVYNEK